MLNQLKSFFSKFKRQPEASSPPPAAPRAPQTTKPAVPAKPAAVPKPQPAPPAAKPAAAARPSPVPMAAPAPAATAAPEVPDEAIALPLKVVLGKLPAALSALVRSSGSGDVQVSLRKVLAQLPQGSVKISFGELRQGAPAGTFLDVTSQDDTMVELPLPEILSRLNPSLLSRRSSQKTVEVPPEVGNVFGPRGETLISGGAPAASPAAPKMAPSPAAPKPVAPVAPKVAPPVASPQPKPGPAPLPPKPASPAPAPKVSIPTPSRPAEPAVASAASGEVLTLPLANLSDSWPEAIREEIKQNKLGDASVGLPMEQVEIALRSGKIVFPWRQIGAWLKPTPLASTPNGDTPVELPLKVVAPLFISQHRPAKPQKKVAIGENIPDIFSGGTGELAKPASAPAAAPIAAAPAARAAAPITPSIPRPAPTAPSLPKPPATSPAIAMPKPSPSIPVPAAKEPATMGEVFGNAAKKDWSPNEIVQKTSVLKGVSGALLATNDGLLVAGQLAAPLKSETTAAFLPQIFGRMSQYGKELGVGDTTSLTVEFNGIPWHVVKLGHIYFAAIGKAGEPLPTSLLKVITTELGKQK